MYHGWYASINIIRTFRGQGLKRNALISFDIIGNKFQIVVKNINGVEKSFNDMTAEERIRSVTLRKPAEEKKNAFPVNELGLGKTEGIN